MRIGVLPRERSRLLRIGIALVCMVSATAVMRILDWEDSGGDDPPRPFPLFLVAVASALTIIVNALLIVVARLRHRSGKS